MRRHLTITVFALSALIGAQAQVRDMVVQTPASPGGVSRGYSGGYQSTPNRRHDDAPLVVGGTSIRDDFRFDIQRRNLAVFGPNVTRGNGRFFGSRCYRCGLGGAYYGSYYAVPVYVESYNGPDFNAQPSAYSVYGGNIPKEYVAPGAAAVEAAYRQGQLEQRITSLADEVARLRAEKEAREGRTQAPNARDESFANAGTLVGNQAANEAASGPSNAATATLVFRNGSRLDIANYAIVGKTLWVFDEQRARRIALADLDLEATKKVNAESGFEFKIPQSSR